MPIDNFLSDNNYGSTSEGQTIVSTLQKVDESEQKCNKTFTLQYFFSKFKKNYNYNIDDENSTHRFMECTSIQLF